MDIFTTQLTRVVPVPIKPEKLRVKAPAKEGAVRQVNKEKNPIAELSYVEEREQGEHSQQEREGQSLGLQQEKLAELNQPDNLTDADNNKTKGEDDEDVHHLDIYV